VPLPTQKDLDPGSKILRRMRRRKADVADVAGTIASWDVEASAKSKRQMSVVATHAALFLKRLGSRTRRARVLVAEGDMVVHVVADRLHAGPAQRRCSEEAPSHVGETIRLAVPASQKEEQGFCGEILDLNLLSTGIRRVPPAAIADDGFSLQGDPPGRGDDPVAPVPEAVPVSLHGH
jgi:hypothetical protein